MRALAWILVWALIACVAAPRGADDGGEAAHDDSCTGTCAVVVVGAAAGWFVLCIVLNVYFWDSDAFHYG